MTLLRRIITYLLFPLTVWYAIGIALRNLIYASRPEKSRPTAIFSVGIGNLCMGGAGKTPMASLLIDLFSSRHVALLSRGYGRSTTGFHQAEPDSTTETIGDEPLMIYRRHHIPTFVCEDRNTGISLIRKHHPDIDLLLLDDVFQHRKTRPDLLLLLTTCSQPFYDDRILPFGNLREYRSGARRADAIIVTKCPRNFSPEQQSGIRSRLRGMGYSQPLFFSTVEYGSPIPLNADTAPLPPHTGNVLLFTGIAHPEPLYSHLSQTSAVTHLTFPDHHAYSPHDLARIRKQWQETGPDTPIFTTEKDAARLNTAQVTGLPVYFIPIHTRMIPGQELDFNRWIQEKLRNTISDTGNIPVI